MPEFRAIINYEQAAVLNNTPTDSIFLKIYQLSKNKIYNMHKLKR